MAVGFQIAIANTLADLNLAVWYVIAIRIYASKKFWWILIWRLFRQSAKPPNFPAIWYNHVEIKMGVVKNSMHNIIEAEVGNCNTYQFH